MIKLPARDDGRWTVQYANEKMPDIVATRNLTFDKEGYIRLSKPVMAFFTSADDADHHRPIKFARQATNLIWSVTQDRPFACDFRQGRIYVYEDGLANVPQGESLKTSATWFNSTLVVTEGADIKTFTPSTPEWTDISVTLNSSGNHPCVGFISRATVAVGDTLNTVVQYNTSFASGGSTLTIPTGYRIYGMAYNNGFIGISAYDGSFNGNGMFFVWDGSTTAANYAYPLNTNTATTVIPYKNSFAVYNGINQILFWDGRGLVELANMPSYYTSGYGDSTRGLSSPTSYFVDGGIFLLNTNGSLLEEDGFGRLFIPGQSGGVWCYDDMVGLYHRHGTTGNKLIHNKLISGDVDTTANTITVTTAPETGTPVYYYSGGATAVGGLTDAQLYYTIKVDATTVKLATTYALALAGTAVDLTTGITEDGQPDYYSWDVLKFKRNLEYKNE
jgi:hypothetical protein